MNRSIVGLCAAGLAGALSGCATTSAWNDRKAPTGIAPGEAVALVAARAEPCATECPTAPSPGVGDGEFDHCLAIAMRTEKTDLAVLRGEELRRGVVPDGGVFPATVETVLSRLQEDAFRRRLASLNLRYVVVVRGLTTKDEGKVGFAGSDPRLWAIGHEWYRRSSVTAEVVDVAEGRHSGDVTAHSSGKEGYAVPIVLIIPLPPVPFSSPTESQACDAAGKAVVEFLLHQNR